MDFPKGGAVKELRIKREDLFMEVAELFGKRSTCPRAEVGAVAVRQGRIISTGYNGSPSGQPHCTDVGCDLQEHLNWVKERCDRIHDYGEEGWRPSSDPERHEHLIPVNHCVRSVHAEANCIAWAAREGVSLKNADMYTTHGLCLNCAKLVVNAGFRSVTFKHRYDDAGIKLLYDSGVLVHEHA